MKKSYGTSPKQNARGRRRSALQKNGRLYLVVDHPIARRELHFLFRLETDLEVCGHTDCPEKALEDILRNPPAVVLIDLSFKEDAGLQLVPILRVLCPLTKILVFSFHHESIAVEQALRTGADGYAYKEQGFTVLAKEVHTLVQAQQTTWN